MNDVIVARLRHDPLDITEAEFAASKELEAAGVSVHFPGTGHVLSDVYDCWGVYVGSHGGHAKTFRAALRRCLKCCGIGAWWRVDYGKGELLSALFERVAARHLGGLARR